MTGEDLYNAWRDEFGNSMTDYWLDLEGPERDKWDRIAAKMMFDLTPGGNI